MVGRGWGEGGAPDSGGDVYGDRGNGESYFLPPKKNNDNALPIGTQNPKQPECSAQEPRLQRSIGTGGWGGAGSSKIDKETSEIDRVGEE